MRRIKDYHEKMQKVINEIDLKKAEIATYKKHHKKLLTYQYDNSVDILEAEEELKDLNIKLNNLARDLHVLTGAQI